MLYREAVSEPRVPTGDGFWHGSISVGVVSLLAARKSYDDWIKQANNGLYDAKEARKNRVRRVSDKEKVL